MTGAARVSTLRRERAQDPTRGDTSAVDATVATFLPWCSWMSKRYGREAVLINEALSKVTGRYRPPVARTSEAGGLLFL